MKLYLSILLVGLATVTYGQQIEKIKFTEVSYDFGTVKESGGPITHEFRFTNTSSEPIKISEVRASCGCTTPAWTRDEVPPGGSGIIQAQYNPKNRPGPFNKSLTITGPSFEKPLKLYIKGNVLASAKTADVAKELGTALGSVRMRYRSFNMGKVRTTDTPTKKDFRVFNDSDEPINFQDSVVSPSYINLEFIPKTLEAGKEGLIRVLYDAKAKDDLGFINDNVVFFTDEKGSDSRKSVSIYATIEEFFPPLTEEDMANAPRVYVSKAVQDLGRIKTDSKVSAFFDLTNNGKSPLEIRKMKANCKCVTSKIDKMTIAPGASAKVEVKFDAYQRNGNQQKSVTIYSNDPRASAKRITVKAFVEK